MVLTGEPFYVDQGGDHQLRICYTSQPAAARRTGRADAGAQPRRGRARGGDRAGRRADGLRRTAGSR